MTRNKSLFFTLTTSLLLILLCFSLSFAQSSTKKYKFFKLENEPLYYTIKVDKKGNESILVSDIELKLNIKANLSDPESNLVPAVLSPDKTRLLLYVGSSEGKNVWVINLKTKKKEFISRDNLGRHLFIKWLDNNTFELMFAGMGYAVAYTYKYIENNWKLVSEEDVYEM